MQPFLCPRLNADQVTFQRLNQWFVNRASAAKGGNRRDALAWIPLLQRLHQIRTPRPRQRTVIQQFMVDYPVEVNSVFVSRHSDGKNLSKTQAMNFRHDVAKSMLSSELYSCHVKALEKKAEAQQNADLDAWNLILDDISLASDVDQYVLFILLDLIDLSFISIRARDTLFDAVYPLLQAIGSYAGCSVSLIAGSAPKDDTDKGFFTA